MSRSRHGNTGMRPLAANRGLAAVSTGRQVRARLFGVIESVVHDRLPHAEAKSEGCRPPALRGESARERPIRPYQESRAHRIRYRDCSCEPLRLDWTHTQRQPEFLRTVRFAFRDGSCLEMSLSVHTGTGRPSEPASSVPAQPGFRPLPPLPGPWRSLASACLTRFARSRGAWPCATVRERV